MLQPHRFPPGLLLTKWAVWAGRILLPSQTVLEGASLVASVLLATYILVPQSSVFVSRGVFGKLQHSAVYTEKHRDS